MYITATLEMQSAIVKGVFKGPVEWFASAQKKTEKDHVEPRFRKYSCKAQELLTRIAGYKY